MPGHDLGLAITVLTVLMKLILSPFFVQSIRAQRAMQAIQPKLDELKEKYKDNKEKLGQAMMEFYKKEKINPLSSCLPLLIQMPILIAIFQVFRRGLTNGSLELVYSFINRPEALNPISFGVIDWSKTSIVLAILAGLAQFWQSKSMLSIKKNQAQPKSSMASAMNQQMLYFMPIITIVFGATMPSGLTYYWFLTTLLGIAQQSIIFKKMDQNTNNDKRQIINV